MAESPETSAFDQSRIWSHAQNVRPESFEPAVPRLRYLLRQVDRLAKSNHPTVLNIGLGNGYFEREAKRLGWEIVSLDPDAEALQRVANEGIRAVAGRIEQMPFADECFDFIVASEVLEHLTADQRQRGVAEIARILRPGGRFLGTVPYREDLRLRECVCPQCGFQFHQFGHHESFTQEKMTDELAAWFTEVSVRRTAFVDFRRRGFGGRVKSLIRWGFGKAGQQIADPKL
ncbi:class I SAM-dependent methyltransferase [Thalassoroseus pseudoceratinae]|uniref:class I SAM-dependent methyltransferase n=1 Tax=Thalassoroseus pseudoceratinae TaxID=2713176 RepID=UPI0014239289|nr:class I SAM-dependent methyltransferase [Thalassoroseus pseudoceratinae]